ncbi:MAG: hypothetical protein ACOCP8_01120 [archaeon]
MSKQCRAKTKFNDRCHEKAIIDGYCIRHFTMKYKLDSKVKNGKDRK